ncbi:MAG: IS701 family transposase [Phycisphaerae bacterium]|nr:IS701 family transposase [Phycisphaerae bacterium]
MESEQIQSLYAALQSWLSELRVCLKREQTRRYLQLYVLGLLADLKRKRVEPIALAASVPVRTMQEFLSFFVWDHERLGRMLTRRVANRPGPREGGIGVIDATGHAKRGDKTPGVQRQYCPSHGGESGKVDNCVVAQHLLYTDDDAKNPFSCMLATNLYLPESWDSDRDRCREAGIPDSLRHKTKWAIAIDQVKAAIAEGVRFSWLVFDEDYGRIPKFWFELDALGQRGVGEVPKDFRCWVNRPACATRQKCHAARRVGNLCQLSSAFTQQQWKRCEVKETTHGTCVWNWKAALVHLNAPETPRGVPIPTDRKYWRLLLHPLATGEVKYVVSSASEPTARDEMIRALFSRWHVKKWFERAKQEAGLGAFEVRTCTSLIRHWTCVRLAMQFLPEQTAGAYLWGGGKKISGSRSSR